MSKELAKGLAGACGFVFVTLGVIPLVQWFGFGHRSGLIGMLFSRPEGSWIWLAPLLVAAVTLAGVFYFGTRSDRA